MTDAVDARRLGRVRHWRLIAALMIVGVSGLSLSFGESVSSVTPEPVAIIVVSSEAKALQILQRLRGGADFAKLARGESTDPSASEGGYLGMVSPNDLLPELRQALLPVHSGQLSSIVKIPAGYAVLKVLATAPSSTTSAPARTLSTASPAHSRSGEADANQLSTGSGGSATRGTFDPILDSEKRPITRGGFVKNGPVVFQDVAKQAGLTNWHHTMGTLKKNYILETTGSGVALLDYDNDGWLDIYLVNGSTFDAVKGKCEAPHSALFHNNHDGTFTNVAEKAGVRNDRWGFGVAIGDYDNDGWPDIYVSNYGGNRLYHNNRDGTFTDVAD